VSDTATATLAFAADHECWEAAVGSVRHYAALEGLEVGLIDRSGEVVRLTVSGRSEILDPFMRHTRACFGVALRSEPQC
jgi:hypothetical protein